MFAVSQAVTESCYVNSGLPRKPEHSCVSEQCAEDSSSIWPEVRGRSLVDLTGWCRVSIRKPRV